MKNHFQKAVFEFTQSQIEEFTKFLRSSQPLVLVNWPREENRPKFEGLPNYKMIGVFEDYEDEARTIIYAVFEAEICVPGYGIGNVIWLNSYYGIEVCYVSKIDQSNIILYLNRIAHASN